MRTNYWATGFIILSFSLAAYCYVEPKLLPPVSVKSAADIPVCPKNGKHYTARQLTDFALSKQIANPGSCTVKYATLEEFYSRNPKCCDIDVATLFFNQKIEDRRLLSSEYIVGQIRATFLCRSSEPLMKKTEYATAYFNITSCGTLTEFTLVPVDKRIERKFPNKEG